MGTSCVDGVDGRSVAVYSVGRAWRFGGLPKLQAELEDRFSGRKRPPQQVPALAAGGGHLSQLSKKLGWETNEGTKHWPDRQNRL